MTRKVLAFVLGLVLLGLSSSGLGQLTVNELTGFGVSKVQKVVTLEATYSQAVSSTGNDASLGNTDLVGVLFGGVRRTGIRWDTTSIPDGSTIVSASLTLFIESPYQVASDSWQPGPYAGDGVTGNPETDTGTTRFDRLDTTSDNYGTTTDYRTIGTHTVQLAGNVLADLSASLSGNAFSMAVKQVSETTGADHEIDITGYLNGDDGPKLTVTYQ